MASMLERVKDAAERKMKLGLRRPMIGKHLPVSLALSLWSAGSGRLAQASAPSLVPAAVAEKD